MQEGGMEVQALQNRPTLSQWVYDYWEAYLVLGSSRMVHQGGIGSIPLTEIIAYTNVIALRDIDDRLKFIRMIQSLDTVYVKHVNDRANKRAADRKAAAKRHRPRKR